MSLHLGVERELPIVSVVVPVYNTISYLTDCVDSIKAQSYRNIEIILVDDGSEIDCQRLCDEIAKTDSRITVIHKENGGAAESRNYGIREASGDWLVFVDSDDVVSPIYVEGLLSAAMTSGTRIASFPKPCAFGDYEGLSLISRLNQLPDSQVVSAEDMLRLTFYQEYETAPFTKIYHRSVLTGEVFPKGNYYEDLAAIYKIVSRCARIAVVNTTGLYGYRINEQSKTAASFSKRKADDILRTVDEIYGFVSTRYPTLLPAASSRCFSACRSVYAQIPVTGNDARKWLSERDRLWRALKTYRSPILKDSSARGKEKVAVAVSYLGKGAFSAFCKICRKLNLMR